MGPEGYSDRHWARFIRWRRRAEFWIHYPAPVNAGNAWTKTSQIYGDEDL